MATRRVEDHQLHLTGDEAADQLLSTDPNALLIGMVLDQQITMEKAFAGPAVIAERMGGRLDVGKIAELPVAEFVTLCSERPAVHRFPGSMGTRVHEVCQVLVRDWDADAARCGLGGHRRAAQGPVRSDCLASARPRRRS